MQIAEGIEEVLESLEMVVLEEVLALREAKKLGAAISPAVIAEGYLNSGYGLGQQLSNEAHTMGLACMMGVALYWLACQEEPNGG